MLSCEEKKVADATFYPCVYDVYVLYIWGVFPGVITASASNKLKLNFKEHYLND